MNRPAAAAPAIQRVAGRARSSVGDAGVSGGEADEPTVPRFLLDALQDVRALPGEALVA